MAIWMIFLACYLAFIILFMAIPASLGLSFGIRNLYLATLYKVFEVSYNYAVANRSLIVHRIEDYLYNTLFVRTCSISMIPLRVLIAAILLTIVECKENWGVDLIRVSYIAGII